MYALDGKARRGMRKKDEEGQEYGLSVYDVVQAKVLSQVEVGRKENEIVKAPKALKISRNLTKSDYRRCHAHPKRPGNSNSGSAGRVRVPGQGKPATIV